MKMMKVCARLSFLCLLLVCALVFIASAQQEAPVDYAGALRLNMSSETAKQEVTVKTFVDGDTTHFYVPAKVMPSGVLKARYLAVNTPEVTGKVEEYGKKASEFTKARLISADKIIIESENGKWNPDSTGGRYLVFVWYRPAGEKEFRNLNVELLQNGLARANSSANNRYGDVCMAAIAQAKESKLSIYSGKRDPDFYYGEAVELTIKELRRNPSVYEGIKVAFKGVITLNDAQSVLVEDYDAETGLYFGIPVYYGYGLSGAGLDILSVGNESRVVGTLQYYEAGDTYQVSGVSYRMMRPNDPGNLRKLGDGHTPSYTLTSAETLARGTTSLDNEDGAKTYDYAALALCTSVELRGLTVTRAYASGNQAGMVTLMCEQDGVEIKVRAISGRSAKELTGSNISVKGFVDCDEGEYYVRVYSENDLVIHP